MKRYIIEATITLHGEFAIEAPSEEEAAKTALGECRAHGEIIDSTVDVLLSATNMEDILHG